MPTSTQPQFQINGVIDTNKTVLQNLEVLCSAAGCWLSYDIAQAKWAVVINKTGSSVASFDDTNIVGSIGIASTGITELYNSVEIEFPHKDIKDRIDYITLSIPDADRYPNELDNVLKIQFDCINDPLHAELLASRELKQSRVDKVINFRTDYSYMGLKAGDLIDVTSSVYSYYNKVFRIVKITEEDSDDGVLSLSITALEYDADVYDTTGLTRTERFIDNGIIPEETNTAIDTSNDQSTGTTLLRLLASTALTGLINMTFSKNPLTGKITQILNPTSATRDATLTGVKQPTVTITGPDSMCEGSTLTLNFELDCSSCLFDTIKYDYTITGVQTADIGVPLTGTVNVPGSISIPILADGTDDAETLVFTVGGSSKSVAVGNGLTYTYSTSASPSNISVGATSTVTLTTTGVANGTSVPYTITGSGTGKVTTPLTGTVTVNSNSATLSVVTTDDFVYAGTLDLLVTFNQSQLDPCSQLDKTAAITISDNVCKTVTIPVVWCPNYNKNGQVYSLTPVKYATVQAPVSGGTTTSVPLTVSVTVGSPSTVTVASTVSIDTTANKAGQDFKVITSFNSIPANGVVTGTTTTVTGY